MTERRVKCALAALPWSLGLVVLIEAVFFVMPNARARFRQVSYAGRLASCPRMGRDHRLRPVSDSTNRSPRRMDSGERLCIRDRHSPPARYVQRRESSHLHRRGRGGSGGEGKLDRPAVVDGRMLNHLSTNCGR